MTWPLVLAVLFGALLHAAWNALIRSAGDKRVETALVAFAGGLIASLLLPWTGLPTVAALPYLLDSMVIHLAYYLALAGAYQHAELSFAYPIMRGFAPLLVTLASAGLIGEAPSVVGWLGAIGIAAGVLLIGFARPGGGAANGRALSYAVANAAVIASYTVVDGLGVRAGGDALTYVLVLYIGDGLLFPALVWLRWPAARRIELLDHLRRRLPIAAIGGAASLGAYAIALWAMRRAPVASVAALRETSVLFAALLGTLWLSEPFSRRRASGTLVIVVAVMLLRFA